MSKHVTIGLKMDESFIRLLDANVQLSKLKDKNEMEPRDQLALTVLMEARGATDAQVHASILNVWRPHLEVISEIRRVDE